MNIQNLIQGALKTVQKTIGSEVVYQRGSLSVELCAGLGSSPFETVDENGVMASWRSRDFLFDAAELELNGQQIEPQRGDLIRLPAGDKVEVYRVQHPDPKQHPWRYCDPTNTAIRVHTARVDVVPAS